MTLHKFINDVLTGADNKSVDVGRVAFLASYAGFFIFGIVSVCLHHPWTALDYSSGVTAMAVGWGVNLKLKKDTEPHADKQARGKNDAE